MRPGKQKETVPFAARVGHLDGTEAPDVRPGLDRFWSQPRIHGFIRVVPIRHSRCDGLEQLDRGLLRTRRKMAL
jgi:hypothetical protein